MARPFTEREGLHALKILKQAGGNLAEGARIAGVTSSTFKCRIEKAKAMGLHAGDKEKPVPEEELLGRLRRSLGPDLRDIDTIAHNTGIKRSKILPLCRTLHAEGANIFIAGNQVSLEKTPVPVSHDPDLHVFKSDKRGHYRFGIVSDNHLCSKYAREDVLGDLYDTFQREGITRVYNAGNWIDGEARFNKFDLHVYGMTPQLEYFAKHYPQRRGITTYYVAGDDHEGWYARDHGADIGRMAEQVAIDHGRRDLRYLGYMESFIRLQHLVTGRASQMLVVHPGGGSAYAISYSPQKFVESLQGGEKPAVVIFGHWHKMDVFNYRNVWCIQAGTTEDQTPFMRKQKLEAHVGGLIVELTQDDRGAITRCKNDQIRYFDRGYYNNGYSVAGRVNRNHVRRSG